MKVLLDECVHQDFRHRIPGHDVFTVGYMGWRGTKNGALLRLAMNAGFDAFVTTDHSIPAQQNVAALSLALVILHSPSNALKHLEPLAPALLATLAIAKPGVPYDVKP